MCKISLKTYCIEKHYKKCKPKNSYAKCAALQKRWTEGIWKGVNGLKSLTEYLSSITDLELSRMCLVIYFIR